MSAPAGPYIVEHRQPVAPDDDGSPFCAACSHYHDGACLCPDCGRPTPCRDHGQDRSVSTPATTVGSRWAYATPEEAQNAVSRLCEGKMTMLEQVAYAESIGESGGSIKLPDGSEIVVEATTVRDMLLACPEAGAHLPALEDGEELGVEDAVRAVNAAYNARFGTAAQESQR